MLTQEQIVTIKVRHKQGQSISAIARELRMSRNTVRKYLKAESTVPCYHRTAPAKPSKLEPFYGYIQDRVTKALPEWIPATVIYHEIKAKGYTGKLRILQRYLCQLKPAPKPDPVVRFETEPGEQLQVDFTSICSTPGRTLKAFVATLGYSRASFVYFYNNERSEAWLDGLKRCFAFFGGVPKEVLFDNAKCIMIERDAYAPGEHRWNPQLLALAKDYGFIPRACRPYRAKTKGKVERFNRYLKESFVLPLKVSLMNQGQTLSVQQANTHVRVWLNEVANQRVHGTTAQIPVLRLRQEQEAFIPLPTYAGNGTQTSLVPTREKPLPIESLQHPLSLYDQLLENRDGTYC